MKGMRLPSPLRLAIPLLDGIMTNTIGEEAGEKGPMSFSPAHSHPTSVMRRQPEAEKCQIPKDDGINDDGKEKEDVKFLLQSEEKAVEEIKLRRTRCKGTGAATKMVWKGGINSEENEDNELEKEATKFGKGIRSGVA